MLEGLRYFVLQKYLHFLKVMNNGLHNFPGIWKSSNSFCAYFGLTWYSPQKDQEEKPTHMEEKKKAQNEKSVG